MKLVWFPYRSSRGSEAMYSNIHRITVSVGLAMLMLIAGCGGGDSPVDPGNGGSEAAALEFSDLNPRPVRGEFRSVHSAGGTSVAVGDDGVIAVRPAGESAWVNATSSNVENFTAVEMLDEQFGVAVGEDGGWDTVDGGRTWNRADEVRGMRDIALRAGVGVMVGGSKVLRSLDLDTWNTSTHDEFDFQSIDFAHDGLLYGVGFGTLARSTNLGQNWIPVTGPPGSTASSTSRS